MSEPVSFAGMMVELGKFQSALADAHGSLRNEKHKQILGELLARLQEQKSKAEATIPPILAQIRDRFQRTESELKSESERIQKQHKALKERLEKARKQPPAGPPSTGKPATPEPKINPDLGAQLRLELLQRFGCPAGDPSHGPATIKEAWEDWQ